MEKSKVEISSISLYFPVHTLSAQVPLGVSLLFADRIFRILSEVTNSAFSKERDPKLGQGFS